MLETPKPFNVYHTPSASDFSPCEPLPIQGRRTSFGAFMRTRKLSAAAKLVQTTMSTGSPAVPPPLPAAVSASVSSSRTGSSSEESRKASAESQLGSSLENSASPAEIMPLHVAVDINDEDEDQFFLSSSLSPRPIYTRRMSIPESVFLSADYAILRHSSVDEDSRFELVTAFDRNADPYRRYMQSLTCYDLAPTHGAVVMMDGELKVHKALTALSQSGHSCAIVTNMDRGNTVLTISDCLRAIVMAADGESRVAEETLSQFMADQNRKRWVTANVNTSVWDAARLLVLNRVHRLPILQCELGDVLAGSRSDDVLYILTLKNIFIETVLKLNDPKLALGPHVKQRTLSEAKVGTWTNIYTLSHEANCGEAINMFFDKSISCIPVVDAGKRVIGLLSKADIMAELVGHPTNYLEILDLSVTAVMSSASSASSHGTPCMSILDTISLLVSSDRPSLCIIDFDRRPVAIVSYSDLMDYIQNYAEVHHKATIA
ncbi:hypothetical protein PFISCL1PPCAC_23906 [Pristionchus fissidentatus]|uniref:CBS domain-containing protein n=1 Tax=Pristionchus fissidentatus TaxID=1538716 RepID=A0AAV5WPL4_9BILA|nr:hypothetical protein PFISCL1PPCAC_23906 [Pristionchus fissidentatus]